MALPTIKPFAAEETKRPTERKDPPSFEALALRQGVRPVERFEDLLGGWPVDDVDDGFEKAVAGWRSQEREEPKRA